MSESHRCTAVRSTVLSTVVTVLTLVTVVMVLTLVTVVTVGTEVTLVILVIVIGRNYCLFFSNNCVSYFLRHRTILLW